ncbi:MAG: AAA family ATPase [Halobacteriota archaeon]
MIERVHVSNFKCIKEQALGDITPIVGIWGRNGSGKSSLLQAIIWVLKNGGNFNAGGISLGSAQDVVFGQDPATPVSVEVFLSGENKYQCKIVKGGLQGGGESYDRIRYFPPWRHISQRTGRINEQIKSDLGIIGPGIHTFMHHYFHNLIGRIARDDEEAKMIYQKINNWAEKIGFGKLLDSQRGHIEVMGTYHDEIMDLEVPIVDGGFGGNSFLPILLEGYSFTDGILLVEEPEISLHPASQSEVLDFFVEMVKKRKHQIIFTSHSEYMVKKIARAIKEEKLSSDLISVYVAKKDDENGTKFERKDNQDLVRRLDKGQDIILELTKRN